MSFESRFGQAADAYQTFRPDYPEEIFRRILGWIPAEKRNFAIDLGAGTGKASRELVKSFRVVEDVELSHSRKMTPAEFAGFWRSTSYGGAYGRALDDPEFYCKNSESRSPRAGREDKIPVDFK